MACINTSKPNLMGYCFIKNTKLKRRKKKNCLRVVGGYLVRATKARIIGELIAIFHLRDKKS